VGSRLQTFYGFLEEASQWPPYQKIEYYTTTGENIGSDGWKQIGLDTR
jgi:hypothetical protein